MEEQPSTGNQTVRERIKHVSQNFFLHIHAPRIHTEVLTPQATWGLGVILASLFFTLIE